MTLIFLVRLTTHDIHKFVVLPLSIPLYAKEQNTLFGAEDDSGNFSLITQMLH